MKKIVLGIETSCDDTSVAVITKENNRTEILSHLAFGQADSLEKWGGVVPEIAARNHLEKISPLIKSCLKESQITANELSAIAVTTLPGLLGPLLTGVNAAKTLCLLYEKPLIATNHLYAHLEAIHLTQPTSYPYLGILISGGHSIFFKVSSATDFKVLGSTIDDAAGEAFDKGGKLLGLGYPAGHLIDRCASWGNRHRFEFPIGMRSSADARLSFSGLKTALSVFCEKNPHIQTPPQLLKPDNKFQSFYDFCASYQNAISRALLLKARYALKSMPANCPIVLGGGVACNSMIRQDFQKKYQHVSFVEPQFCTDNGAMIAHYGLLHLDRAIPFPACLEVDARGRFLQKGNK